LHRRLADFGRVQQAEQPFTAVQSKAKLIGPAIIENYDWHCREVERPSLLPMVAIENSESDFIVQNYGLHQKNH
jgi:hypothetical protein